MPTTVGNFSAIDDTEVDAESPITETLVTRLRDNSYWINEGTNKTTNLTAGEYLESDGSGGVRWTVPTTIAGTKGTISHNGDLGTSYTTITTATSGYLRFSAMASVISGSISGNINVEVTVKLSDNTFVGVATHIQDDGTPAQNSSVFSGTITTGQQVGYSLDANGTANQLLFRRDSGNLQYASDSANDYLYANWFII